MNKDFYVGDVLKESFNFIVNKPVILLPMFIALLIGQIIDRLTLSSIDISDATVPLEDILKLFPLLLAVIFISLMFQIVADGMYPQIIKNMIEKKEIELITAFRHVIQHALPLIAANILIFILIFIGTLFFIIPGVLFIIWYFYTVPAIMLENRGALAGMKASKSFAADKKFKTFLVFIVPLLIFLPIDIIATIVLNSIPTVLETVSLILYSLLCTWISIIPAYIYIKKYEKLNVEL